MSVRHITSNFDMFGFNPDIALFQAVKELIENSLDAAVEKACEINLNINATQVQGQCSLEVLDNGCGIADISKSLACFCTSKAYSGAFTAGKFGYE